MKKIKNPSLIILGLCFLFSCKSSITGYWKGAVGHIELTILQRPDGTAGLYKRLAFPPDTATSEKIEGTWELQGNAYTADFLTPYSTIRLSAPVYAPVTYIAGTIILVDSTGNNAYAFYVEKQKRKKP